MQLEGSNLEGDSHTDELEDRARTELQRHSTPEQSLQLQTSASMGTNELDNECELRDDEREVEEDEREIEDSGDLESWSFEHASGIREVESISEVAQAISDGEKRALFLSAIGVK